MTTISFDVVGDPRPQGSKKGFYNKHTKRVQIVDDNPVPLKDWRNSVGEAAVRARGAGEILEGPVLVELTFWLSRPKDRKPWVRWPWKKPDVDKLARAVLDALTKTVWLDDAQVCWLVAKKRYSTGPTGCSIRIEVLAEEPDSVPPMWVPRVPL